jgi:zinc/manganese transport system permease protein
VTGALDLLLGPFREFAFMGRALLGAVLLAASCAPVGVFLIQRRMSLAGDAMAHAILPGIAAGVMLAGLSLWAMTLGGVLAGLAVALLSGLLARLTPQKEDVTLAALYLVALALGVVMVASQGARLDLLHLLFGSVLAVDSSALVLLAINGGVTLLAICVIWRPLALECLDPGFSRARGPAGALAHSLFLGLVVLNLVAGFQAMGTLMAVGLLILPGAAARFWSRSLPGLVGGALAVGLFASVTGLLASYYLSVPSGPAIVLAAGGVWSLSMLFGRFGGLAVRLRPWRRERAGPWIAARS